MGSTANLVFRVRADSADAEAIIARFREGVGDLGDMGVQFQTKIGGAGHDARHAMEEAEYSATEARHAMHGLGEEIGVHLPRFVQSFLAEIPAVGSVMSAAFAPIAIIGLIQVAGELIEKVREMVPAWKEAEEAEKEYAKQVENSAKDFAASLAKLKAEYIEFVRITQGPEAAARLTVAYTEQDLKKQDAVVEELKKKYDELMARIARAKELADPLSRGEAGEKWRKDAADAQKALHAAEEQQAAIRMQLYGKEAAAQQEALKASEDAAKRAEAEEKKREAAAKQAAAEAQKASMEAARWVDMATKGAHDYVEALLKVNSEMERYATETESVADRVDALLAKQAEERAAGGASAIELLFGKPEDFIKASELYEREAIKNQEALDRMLRANETHEERLNAEYQLDLQRFSAAAEAKAVAAIRAEGASDAQVEAIHQQYAALRAAATDKYGKDLQSLTNSTGWQDVFGSRFGELLKGDEEKLREWSSSANQSLLLVQNAAAMLGQQGREAFDQFEEGMGQSIASAIVYDKSIGQAMRSALASTLESIAARDLVLAIDAMAWGFYDLAMGDYEGAASAFSAAALFGAVGGAAAVAGRFAAGGSQGAPRAGAAASSGAGGAQTPASTPLQQAGPGVHVYVQGNLVGWDHIDELASAINDAVLNRDVTLTATNTTSGAQVVR